MKKSSDSLNRGAGAPNDDRTNRDDLLTVEEEVALILKIQKLAEDSEAAKEKLVRANRRFVVAIAGQYSLAPEPEPKLIEVGIEGLKHAIYTFNPGNGFKFICYAIWFIRKSIEQYIDENV